MGIQNFISTNSVNKCSLIPHTPDNIPDPMALRVAPKGFAIMGCRLESTQSSSLVQANPYTS